MKTIIKIMAVIVCCCMVSHGGVISVDFYKDGLPVVDTSVFSGVEADTVWAEVNPQGPGTYNFSNLDGSTLDVETYSGVVMNGSDNGWRSYPNFSGVQAGTGDPSTVTLSDIPYSNYYVIVYLSGWGSPYKGQISAGSVTKYADFLSVTPGEMVESTDTDNSDGYDAGSYVILGSKSSPFSTNMLLITATKISGAVSIGGFQIVEVEPEFPAPPPVISIDFYKDGFPQVDTNTFTGVVFDSTWVELNPESAGTYSYANQDGTSLDVGTYAGAAMVGSDNGWRTYPNFSGIVAANNDPAIVTLSSIPYDYYYVIVYLSGWYSGYQGAFSDGTTTKYANFVSATVGEMIESTDTDNGDGYDAGSYVVFGSTDNPLSSSSLTLSATKFSGAVAIGGFQIVQVDEPLIDGIPSGWINGYFGSTAGFSGSTDSDSDGFSNLEEYLSDTDPTDSGSLLKMLGVSLDFTNVVVSYQNGGSNANVIVEYRADAGSDWKTLATNVAPASVTNTYTHATTGSGGWYRTKAERP